MNDIEAVLNEIIRLSDEYIGDNLAPTMRVYDEQRNKSLPTSKKILADIHRSKRGRGKPVTWQSLIKDNLGMEIESRSHALKRSNNTRNAQKDAAIAATRLPFKLREDSMMERGYQVVRVHEDAKRIYYELR